MSALNLCSLAVGQRAVIQDIAADEALRQRMQAMGLRTGREALIVRLGRLGGPIQVRVGSVSLMLRRSDAARVQVLLAP